LIGEHEALRNALGGAPSVHSIYRFCKKLRENKPLLDACLSGIIAALGEHMPELGRDVAVDATDMAAFSNGQKFLFDGGPERERFSDGDATWGHRSAIGTRSGGGYFGFKLHLAVDAASGIPLGWEVQTARVNESLSVPALLDTLRSRGFHPQTCSLDRGYDSGAVYEACEAHGTVAIFPLRKIKSFRPKGAPTCDHGTWTFGGADFKRRATKWRCPTGECQPKSVWIKADRLNPLIPRETRRWRDLYNGRTGVEREFGRLKNDLGLTPLRVRGIERVALHVDLTLLVRLGLALARARAVPLAA
jgi:hypothetical protein